MDIIKKNKEKLIFVGIVLVALILRFVCLDKAGGLWYDEIVTYKEASQSNILYVLFYTLNTDVHLPLYPIVLHFWCKIFSFSDYALRAFSAVCGVITVIGSYFVGKELKSKQTGLFCASLFAVNGFLIFYSQEVRLYSFLMMLSTFNLLFLLRVKNDFKNKWNYIGLVASAFAVINAHTLGFIFIGAQFLAFIIYLILYKNEDKKYKLKSFLIASGSVILLNLLLFIYLYLNRLKYINEINGYYCDWSSLFVVVQNWFSPVLVGLYNNPVHYMKILFSDVSVITIIFIFIPIAMALYSIFHAIKKDKFSIVILSGVLFFLLSEIIAFKFTNFKILSRYTSVVFPNVLILFAYGLSQVDLSNRTKKIVLSTLLLINLFYLIVMSDSAFKMPRNGFRPLAQIVNSSGINKDDFIVVWNRTEILDKYVNKRLNKLSLLRNFAYTSERILGNENKLKKLSLNDRKKLLRAYFASDDIPQNTIYLMDAIYEHALPGQKFIITTTKNFDGFTQESFTKLVDADAEYNRISFNDLLTIKSLINIKQLCYQKFHLVKKVQNGQYVVIIFEK